MQKPKTWRRMGTYKVTGSSGRERLIGISAGQTTWVYPIVVGALTVVFGKLGAKRVRLLVVGLNCACTDAIAVATMGYNPRAGRGELPFQVCKDSHTHPPEQLIPPGESNQYADNTVLMGESAGLGSADLSQIDVRGVPIKDAIYDYQVRWKGQAPI